MVTNNKDEDAPQIYFSSEQCNVVFNIMDAIEGRELHPQFDKYFICWNELRNFFAEQQTLFTQYASEEPEGPQEEGVDEEYFEDVEEQSKNLPPPPPPPPEYAKSHRRGPAPQKMMRPDEPEPEYKEPPRLVPKRPSLIVEPQKKNPTPFSMKNVLQAVGGVKTKSEPVIAGVGERASQSASVQQTRESALRQASQVAPPRGRPDLRKREKAPEVDEDSILDPEEDE